LDFNHNGRISKPELFLLFKKIWESPVIPQQSYGQQYGYPNQIPNQFQGYIQQNQMPNQYPAYYQQNQMPNYQQNQMNYQNYGNNFSPNQNLNNQYNQYKK